MFGRQFGGKWIPWSGMLCLMLLVTACLPQGMRLPESPLLRTLERKSGLIAYAGSDGNIYAIDQGGGGKIGVTTDAKLAGSPDGDVLVYQYPTWSPARRHLALVGIRGMKERVLSTSIFIADIDEKNLSEAYRSEVEYPFYLYWSPDGNTLSFLSASISSGSLSLWTVPALGGEAQLLSRGRLIYWSWSSDNREIAIHSGDTAVNAQETHLTFVHVDGGFRQDAVQLQPSDFLAPAWSPHGEELLLAVETEEGGNGLMLVNRQGMVKQILAKLDGSVAFAWAPDGRKFAYLDRTLGIPQPGDQLKVLDPMKPSEITTVDQDGVVAFFWSPDSRKIALFVPEIVSLDDGASGSSGKGQEISLLNIYVFDTRRGTSKHLARFLPTEQFASLFPFFDQYQHSATIWSPDSQHLVLSAYDSNGNAGIYVLDVSGRLEFRYLTQGQLAYWSWK